MFDKMRNKIKGAYRKMTGFKTIEDIVGAKIAISEPMRLAINNWKALYTDNASWLKEPTEENPEKVHSVKIPARIVRKKAQMALNESNIKITGVIKETVKRDDSIGIEYTESEAQQSPRADYLNRQYEMSIAPKLREQLEFGIALGGVIIKPYPVVDGIYSRIAVDFVHAGDFYPIAYDDRGSITAAVFVQRKIVNEYIYSRVERHTYASGIATVTNRVFRKTYNNYCTKNEELGEEVALGSVEEWAKLAPSASIVSDRILFAYFRMPLANTVDEYSPLGISAFHDAISLIRDVDESYSSLLWEFEGGEMSIDVDRQSLMSEWVSEEGKLVQGLSRRQRRLYNALDCEDEQKWDVFAPQLRDASYINGQNFILRQIEDTCCLSRGTLSDPNDVAKTAEEVRSGKPDSYSANRDIQKALEKAVRDVIYIMNVYADIYKLSPEGNYDVAFEWGDGIQEDVDKESSRRLTQINYGISNEIEYRMWYFGETKEQAIKAITENQALNTWKAKQGSDVQVNGDE